MDSSCFLTILAAAIGFFFLIFKKFRSHQENKETNSSSSSSPPPSLSVSIVDPPTSSSHNWTYDVFPSFRGEDVRRDFLSHIQKEFGRIGITPFIDNEIKRGESIGPELILAIRGSKIAIVLVSKNYASSKWCLDELVEIMKCREEVGQTVMAIFYKVDPSHVKKLTGDFGKVFRKTCAGKSKEDIERWRQALVEVATIAGYDSSNWDNEAAMIEKIAMDVSNELINYVPSSDFVGLVGMRTHMENMNLLLRLDSNEVKMIGIWGPSGVGKTTIARVLYSKYSHQFQLSVFMENIKRCHQNIHGFDEYSAKLQLQKEFLSRIINHEDIKIPHLGVAQDRLKDKRVFVVLDDVDQSVQLDAIAKQIGWFGRGSRIIITTQDKKLLNAHGINSIYKVDFPHDNDEALEMFCMYVFGQKSPYEGFESLAWEVIRLAGELPLGLRVMGSYLKGMPIEEWEEELPRLRTSLDGKMENILKFTYDALCDEDKDLFLHIACFFKDEQIEKVEEHLAKNFSYVRRGLRILAEKSLISISSWGNIEMHDLLGRLGRDIVRKQSIHDPGQRQFLVDARDICKVLSNDTVSRGSVIGAVINISEIEDELDICDLKRMSSLQFLRLKNGDNYYPCGDFYLPQKLNILPPKVRLLDWKYFPMTCLSSNFNPEFLVELKMPKSKLEKLWEGIKAIRNLKWMDLRDSYNLRELPDLSTATNLRHLDLSRCYRLVELTSSICSAINLEILDLSDCSSLLELPSSIGNATNLQNLNLSGCSRLVKLPSSIENATNLEVLNFNGCLSLVELPSFPGNATKLRTLNLTACSSLVDLPSFIWNVINGKKLNLSNCSSLVKLPSLIGNATNIQELNLSGCSSLLKLPSFIGNATNIQELNLSGCSSLVELPSSIENVTKLEVLNLRDCSNLVELPSFIGNATNLKELNLSGCSSLMELPSFIGNATKLRLLKLIGCSSLVEVPSSIWNVINGKQLNLSGCSSLVKLPSSIGNTTNIQELNFSGCSDLVKLPSCIGNATKLEVLNLSNCSNLVELPSLIGNATKLRTLNISDCSKIVEIPSFIGNAINLKELNLSGWSSLVELPSSICNVTNLENLNLNGCSSLVKLPDSIGNTTSLRKLNLIGCLSLVKLPSSIGNAINLEELNICGCSSLVELPSSFGNVTSLLYLNLSGCSSLVELSSSIGNLKLSILLLKGCLKLEAITILNLESVCEFDITDCLSLKKFPQTLNYTDCLELRISYWENFGEFSHIYNSIRVLHLSDERIQEISPWIKELSRVHTLVIKGCTKLVFLPQLPDSLEFLDGENCESLERLHCSFQNNKCISLNFGNCFKLNQEARDLIIKASSCEVAILPGEKVPTHFTYRATGSFLSVKLNGIDTDFPRSLRFKACVLLVDKPGDEFGDRSHVAVTYGITERHNGISFTGESILHLHQSQHLKEHLYTFHFEEWVRSNDLVIELKVNNGKFKIEECGIIDVWHSPMKC